MPKNVQNCARSHGRTVYVDSMATPDPTLAAQAEATSDEDLNPFERSLDAAQQNRSKRNRLESEEEISKEQEQQEGHEQVNRTRWSHPSFFLVLSFNVHDGFLTVFLNRDATTTGKSLFSTKAPRR